MCVLSLSSGRTPCRGQTTELLHNFLCTSNSNCSCTSNSICSNMSNSTCSCTSNSIFSYTSNSTCSGTSSSTFFLLRRTQSVLLNSAASLLNSVRRSFYFAYLLRENSRQWPFHQCILREEFRYFVLCTLFKNVTVSCTKSLHYSVDSGLCITLQL